MYKFGGSWSAAKLDCVEDYTINYLKVMQKQDWYALHYVDAFAGRGRQELKSGASESSEVSDVDLFFGDESERADAMAFLEGSALRALKASRASARGFDQFTLIDADRSSCDELESIIVSDYPEIGDKLEILCEDANGALNRYIDSVDWSRSRGLVFLDPYGLEVGWDTILRIAQTRACDVWYLFPLGGVIRMMVKDGQIPESWKARLDRLFGTDRWYSHFYRPSGQGLLFEDQTEHYLRDASTADVARYVRERLSCAFYAVSQPGILRNSKGAPLFALFLGVSNPSKKAQEVAIKIGNYLIKGLSP